MSGGDGAAATRTRVDAIAARMSGLAEADVVARVFAAIEAGSLHCANPADFVVFETAERARAMWVLRQCRRYCPDFAFRTNTTVHCFRASYTVTGALKDVDADDPRTVEVAPDPARRCSVLERLAGEPRDALVAAARATVDTAAFDDGVVTFRARLSYTCARATMLLIRPELQSDGFFVYIEAGKWLVGQYSVHITAFREQSLSKRSLCSYE